MAIQSVAFLKNKSPRSVNGGRGWTVGAAQSWLRAHGFRTAKKDTTENQHRFRQFPPSECRTDSFRTLTEDVPKGVQLIDCKRES